MTSFGYSPNDPFPAMNQVPVQDKYSEREEEPFILKYFQDRNVSVGTFVDIGANNGWKGSNTYALMRSGWSGLEIEADPNTFKNLVQTCEPYKNVTCMHAAICDRDGEIRFWSHNALDSGLSSIHAGYHPDNMTEYQVKCLTLDNALTAHFGDTIPPIDFMNVDIEGADFPTLQAYSFRVKPQLLMVERRTDDDTCHDKFKATKAGCQNLLLPHGYQFIFENFANLAFDLKP